MSDPSSPEVRAERRWWPRVLLLVAAVLVALTFGITTASVESSLGPHEARYDVTTDDTVTIDLGPLGTLQIDSPLPLTLGVRVTVQEIPASVTELDQARTLAALSGDLQSYLQFFSGPQATIQDVARALGVEALERTVLALAVLVGGWYLVRFLVGAARRAELHDRVRPHLRSVVVGDRRRRARRHRPDVERRAARPAVGVAAGVDGVRRHAARGRARDGPARRRHRHLRRSGHRRAAQERGVLREGEHVAAGRLGRAAGAPHRPPGARPDQRSPSPEASEPDGRRGPGDGRRRLRPALQRRDGAPDPHGRGGLGRRPRPRRRRHDDQRHLGRAVLRDDVRARGARRRGAGDVAGQPRLRRDVEELRPGRGDGAGRRPWSRWTACASWATATRTRRGSGPAARRRRARSPRPRRRSASPTSRATTTTESTCSSSTRRPSASRPWTSGCVPAQISGHLHRRYGPERVDDGVRYISSSTAGATLGQPTVGPLNGVAEMTVLRWDPDTPTIRRLPAGPGATGRDRHRLGPPRGGRPLSRPRSTVLHPCDLRHADLVWRGVPT